MATVKVDVSHSIKPMKPMHAGGQPPIGGKDMTEHFHYLTEAGIPFSRLHDVGGVYGANRFVDIPNIFRGFDADETDPANYDFTFTDHLIKALIAAGVEPYYRLGISIENHAYIKPYRTFPPKDPNKWARICEHIIRHYTEGWADGFCYHIRYWEIWNEPEVSRQQMWCGTDEEFYHLYTVTAKHLKTCFPHLKIGGYGSCGFYAVAPTMIIDEKNRLVGTVPPSDQEQRLLDFFHGFFAYITEHNAPIDFFSWHCYADTGRVAIMDAWLHEELAHLGYPDLETHLNEWDPFPQEFGTAHQGAEIAAMMMALQHGHTDLCCIYDMRTNSGVYAPLFNIVTHKPYHGYYALAAFNRLYRLNTQVETVSDHTRLYALAASDGKENALLLSNLTGEDQALQLEGICPEGARYYILDQERLLSWAPNANGIPNNAVMLIEW